MLFSSSISVTRPRSRPRSLRGTRTIFFVKKLLCSMMLLGLGNAVAADFSPEVLHRFSVEAATGGTGELVGAKPHTPPAYNPVDGRLYGVTPEGGLLGIYSTQYRFTPGADIPDYEGRSNEVSVVGGFYTGLVVNSDGIVFGGANPLVVPSPFPYPTAVTGLLFQWSDIEGMKNAFPGEPTKTEYGSAFDLRGLMDVDMDGNTYFGGGSGRAGMALYRRTSDGELQQLVDFSRAEYVQGSGSSSVYLKGQYPAAVLFSDIDRAVYGITVQTQSGGAGDPNSVPLGDEAAGTLIRIAEADFTHDGSSTVDVLHTFARNAEGEILASDSGQHSLVEVGHWLYGTTNKAIWRIRKNEPGSFTLLHRFGNGEGVDANDDGSQPHGPLVLAEDGHLYGTTRTSFAKGSPAQAGTLFRIRLGSEPDHSDDTYEQLHQFDIETDGAWPVGLTPGPSANGIHTLYGATARGGSTGNTLTNTSAEGLGTVYALNIKIPGNLALNVDQEEINYGDKVNLTWNGDYLDNCIATGEWEGEKLVDGTETITPNQVGEAVYILDCQDIHGNDLTATARVQVN